MKPAFDITTENMDSALLKPCTLLLELNERQLTCAWVNKNNHQLLRLKQYHFELSDDDPATVLQDLVESDDHLQQEIREAVVIYNYGDTNLLPDPYFTIEVSKPLAELVTGNAHKGLVLSEKIFGREMYSIYRIPAKYILCCNVNFRPVNIGIFTHCCFIVPPKVKQLMPLISGYIFILINS
jgi:hypothetical protein